MAGRTSTLAENLNVAPGTSGPSSETLGVATGSIPFSGAASTKVRLTSRSATSRSTSNLKLRSSTARGMWPGRKPGSLARRPTPT